MPADDHNTELYRDAARLMPGGVNSPVRSFSQVGGTPRFIVSGSGCRVRDANGREYVDYIGSWGPLIAGHAHPAIVAAVQQAAAQGTSYGMPCPAETELAREIIAGVPSIEKVRMVSSGTEAVMSAVRLARAVTHRNKVIKFAGCYHGHCDALLVEAGSGIATLGLPGTPGTTPGATADTLSAVYNDLSGVERLFAEFPDEIAAVIVEPVAGNMGVVLPVSGFLEGLRQLTRDHGSVLIFDEVMTGFRLARGGAQELLGVSPDLTTLGKIIGGGLPVGAYGGAAVMMDQVAPQGTVYQAGTLSGNPVGMAAGHATLDLLDADAYGRLERRAATLQEGLQQAVHDAGITACVQRAGSMLTVFFNTRSVQCFSDAQQADHQAYARFFHQLLDAGVHLPPSGYEAWFVSLAHDDETIDHTIRCCREALRAPISNCD